MHQNAIDHLRERDPKLARIIDRIGACELAPRTGGSHFDALVRAIVYQQLSGKAAATIHGRVEALYGDRSPTPQEILATDDERLRAAGLSWQKISYIKDLATRVASGDLAVESLDAMPDDEVITSLVRVKGIGRWSAQMFLMFRLGRPNILPDLDLGVQRGIQHAYRLPALPTPKDVLRIGERWAPYASVASWYMWRLLELPEIIRKESSARSAARTRRADAPAKTRPAARKTARVGNAAPATRRGASKKKAAGARTKKATRAAAVRKRTVRKHAVTARSTRSAPKKSAKKL
jgi:DNA-3-methyladenine glycosylase II